MLNVMKIGTSNVRIIDRDDEGTLMIWDGNNYHEVDKAEFLKFLNIGHCDTILELNTKMKGNIVGKC